MLENSQVIITAWADELLVGVSRAITDFAYCCYLSDLAVDETYQHKGIGKELIKRTQNAAGPQAKLILLAAPAAINYYPKIGMEQFAHCFISKEGTDQ
jgi:predicted N-acetyltransferase YhbS